MLYKCLSWWLRHIKSILPAAWLRFWENTACTLHITLNPEFELTLSARIQKKIFPGGVFSLDQDHLSHQDAIQHFIKKLPRPPSHSQFQIHSSYYIASEVSLPLAAEENLTQALTFQMSQLTPFNTNEVVFFSGIKQRFPDQKKLLAWFVVLPNQSIQPVLAIIQPMSPVLMQGPHSQPASEEPIQLTYRLGNKRRFFSFKNNTTLLALGLVIFCSVLGLHTHNLLQYNDHVQQQLVTVRGQALQASHFKDQLAIRHQQASVLTERKVSAVPITALWDDITQRLTDDTWLHHFEVQGRELYIRGTSTDASLLIQLLEASPYLHNVSFISSVTRDQDSAKERFYIGANLIVPGDL